MVHTLNNIMENISKRRETRKSRNDCTIFDEFIASKLERFNERTRTILQHQITRILLNAELNYISSQ